MKKTIHDWSRLDAMTDEEIHAAALSDPDAQPLTPETMKFMKRTPQVRVIRRALQLSQEEFSARFRIPLGTLRDWEQGRKDPDAAARLFEGDRPQPLGGDGSVATCSMTTLGGDNRASAD
jgi:putative transcriptional regulator